MNNKSIEKHSTCRHSDRYNFACGECIEKMIQSAKKETAREIGLLASKAGLSVINLDKQEDWIEAVKKIK